MRAEEIWNLNYWVTLSKNNLHFWTVDLVLGLLVKYVNKILGGLPFALLYPVFMEMILNASLVFAFISNLLFMF